VCALFDCRRCNNNGAVSEEIHPICSGEDGGCKVESILHIRQQNPDSIYIFIVCIWLAASDVIMLCFLNVK